MLCLSVCVCVFRRNPSSLRPKSSMYRFIIGFCWISTRGFSKKTFRLRVMASFAYHDYCRVIYGSFFDWISFSSCCEASCCTSTPSLSGLSSTSQSVALPTLRATPRLIINLPVLWHFIIPLFISHSSLHRECC